MVQRREFLTWNDVQKLIDHLLPQFGVEFDAMLLVTRGGVVPGGILAEAMKITLIFTASVNFPAEMEDLKRSRLLAWPKFSQFPPDSQLKDKRILIVDDVWGSGRTITAVKNRVSAAGGSPYTCVLHFNPYRNLFGNARPDFFAATTDAFIIFPWEVDRDLSSTYLSDYS